MDKGPIITLIEKVRKKLARQRATRSTSFADLAEHEKVHISDLNRLYNSPAISLAENYPEVPAPTHSLTYFVARWVLNDIHGEQMPGLAADLLEAGYDTPTLRRLAGETEIHCSADAETLVVKVFSELNLRYPLPREEAQIIYAREMAREVIAGERNAWTAAAQMERIILPGDAPFVEIGCIYDLNDRLHWDVLKRDVETLTSELHDAMAEVALLPDPKPPGRDCIISG